MEGEDESAEGRGRQGKEQDEEEEEDDENGGSSSSKQLPRLTVKLSYC